MEQELNCCIDSELDILSSILLDKKAFATSSHILTEEDFYDYKARIVYSAMSSLFRNGSEVDITLLGGELKSRGDFKKIGKEFIAELLQRVPSSAGVKNYCERVKKASDLRKLARTSHRMLDAINSGSSHDEVIQIFNQDIVGMNKKDTSFEHIIRSVERVVNHIEDVMQNGEEWGIPCGLNAIDRLLGGFKPHQLIIVAARPGIGKTVMALQIALNVAKRKKKVLFFSLEMGKDELSERAISNISRVNTETLRASGDSNMFDVMIEGAKQFENLDIYIDDKGYRTVDDLWLDVRLQFLMHPENPPSLIIVDYLQLLQSKGNNLNEKTTMISSALKGIAKEFRCPVMALSQLSRKCEERADKRPILADLRDSGSIEQDADVVAMLYRDEYYDHNTQEKNIMDVGIMKNRSGRTGVAKLDYHGDIFSLSNIFEPNIQF